MTNNQALTQFIAKKCAIDDLLAELAAKSADHFSVSPDEVHWGHVGSLSHIEDLLLQALNRKG